MTNYDLLNHEVANAQKVVKRISDLTLPEFKELLVDCFEMLKRREIDTSMEEYKRLTDKGGESNV